MSEARGDPWQFCLYIVGETLCAQRAVKNIEKIFEQNLPGSYSLDIVDLEQNPSLVKSEQILATPTLVRKCPEPIRKIIGDFSDSEKVLFGLDLPVPQSTLTG